MEDKDKIQAHGLTVKEMADLQYKQNNNLVKMVPANNAESIKDKHFQEFEGYEIPEHEQHIYHVVSEARIFNQTTGEKLSNPVVSTFTKEAFVFHKKHNGFAGQSTHILHNPEITSAKEDDDDSGKPEDLNKLTVPVLKERYLELTGEDAPKNVNKAELIDLITSAKED